MVIYVDSNYHCHVTNPDNIYREVEHSFFDNKCDTFIEGYCYNDSEGYVQIYPQKSFKELNNAQRKYEKQLLAEYETIIAEQDLMILDLQYNSLIEE